MNFLNTAKLNILSCISRVARTAYIAIADVVSQCLYKSRHIVCDGIFEMAPDSSFQSYTLRGLWNGEAVVQPSVQCNFCEPRCHPLPCACGFLWVHIVQWRIWLEWVSLAVSDDSRNFKRRLLHRDVYWPWSSHHCTLYITWSLLLCDGEFAWLFSDIVSIYVRTFL